MKPFLGILLILGWILFQITLLITVKLAIIPSGNTLADYLITCGILIGWAVHCVLELAYWFGKPKS